MDTMVTYVRDYRGEGWILRQRLDETDDRFDARVHEAQRWLAEAASMEGSLGREEEWALWPDHVGAEEDRILEALQKAQRYIRGDSPAW